MKWLSETTTFQVSSLCQYLDAGFPWCEGKFGAEMCSVAPWSLEGHAVPSTLWARSCVVPDILFHPVADSVDSKYLFSPFPECHFVCFNPSTSNTAYRGSLPLIVLPVAFHLPGHFKRQCIVNSPPEMRSNTYRAMPITIFITINVSRPIHPLHTFITPVEMSKVFATWWETLTLGLRKNNIFFSFPNAENWLLPLFFLLRVYKSWLWLSTDHPVGGH